MCGAYITLPFRSMPQRLLIEMFYWVIFWITIFPEDAGIFKSISPRAIITDLELDFHNHCKVESIEYVQTHEQHDNSVEDRTIGALALCPPGNKQGGHYFLSLLTGLVLNRIKGTPIPMPEEVKECAHRLARHNKSDRGLIFTDRDNEPIHWGNSPIF